MQKHGLKLANDRNKSRTLATQMKITQKNSSKICDVAANITKIRQGLELQTLEHKSNCVASTLIRKEPESCLGSGKIQVPH